MTTLLAQHICLPTSAPVPGVVQPPTCFDGPIPANLFQNFTLASFVNRAVLFLFPIAGFILFIQLLIAGFNYLTSMGDPKKMEAAKNRLTSSLLGFLMLFLAYWITQIVAFVLGIKNGVI